MNSLPINSAADIKRDTPKKTQAQVAAFDAEVIEWERNRSDYRNIQPLHGNCKWFVRVAGRPSRTVGSLPEALEARSEIKST